MRKLTATLCLTIAVLLGSAGMSNALPKCEGNYNKNTWTNCFGARTSSNGNKYIGELKNEIGEVGQTLSKPKLQNTDTQTINKTEDKKTKNN